ncbi:MAG: phosphatase PAP2 family protein [Microbacterium sp.]|uniref:phosphatase PAP2 family protein n=1 Tax=Microbacterium sp. TaxID=51671 RepID=UPI001AC22799|nr:phosphatase PAP2 family protein [Microbacterium sp.]MBN9178885.1 phosphatase PAP2 family protein [Microbacterium sp.]
MRAAPRAWHFVAAAAALAVVLAASYLFFVQGYMGQLIDEQARTGAQFALVAQASTLLDAVPLLSAGLVVVAVLIGVIRRQVLATTVALCVVAAANLTSQLLKHEVLTRPDNGATGTWHNSFPSGHTTVIVSAVFALFLVSAPRLRPFIAGIGSLAIIAVGALLVGSQWHRPSDVVAGVLVVAIYVFLGGAVLARVRPAAPSAPRTGVAGTVALLVLAAAAAAAALTLAYLTADASTEGTAAATAAGFVAIAAATGGSAVLASRLFRRIG